MRHFIFGIYVFLFTIAVRAARLFSAKMGQFVRQRDAIDWNRTFGGSGDAPLVWFHAASRGEFEALLPLLSRIENAPRSIRVAVSGFSPSLEGAFKKVKAEFPRIDFSYVGPSPFEGDWEFALGLARPALFVGYKYEAWPELWRALGYFRISTAVISAGGSTSLRVISSLERWGFLRLPPLTLFCVTKREADRVGDLVEGTTIRVPEIRWDRQRDLNRLSYPEMPGAPGRPLVVLGSVYVEDLEKLFSTDRSRESAARKVSAHFAVFPHRLDKENVQRLRDWMAKVPVSFEVISTPGVLASFYAVADLAWVGGGYNHGIHSTIQPAYHGLPVYCGPKNVSEFAETERLEEVGQLRVCATPADVLTFWRRIENWEPAREARERDRHRERIAREELGAADRIFEWMRDGLDRPHADERKP